ncbi:MAG: hypothetical protein ILP02_00030, partial [Clostridia bacterium]|nr:hypothetical protein [Clostridia bacterium]
AGKGISKKMFFSSVCGQAGTPLYFEKQTNEKAWQYATPDFYALSLPKNPYGHPGKAAPVFLSYRRKKPQASFDRRF